MAHVEEFTCDNCNANPGDPCTQPTNTGRVRVSWHHYTRTNRAKIFGELMGEGPRALCEDCGHWVLHHRVDGCDRCDDRKDRDFHRCFGMKWWGQRYPVYGATAVTDAEHRRALAAAAGKEARS